MISHRLQFSLRGLFVLTTLAATLTAFVSNAPMLALGFLLIFMPALSVCAVLIVTTRYPRIAALLFALFGLLLLSGSITTAASAYKTNELDDGMVWLCMSMLITFGLLCLLAS